MSFTPISHPRARGLMLLAAVFLAGAMAGAAVDRLLPGREPRPAALLKAPAKEDGIPLQLVRLGLTPAQRERMQAIARRWQPRADSVMQALFPQVREIEHGMFQEMACVLTPAQDSAYLAWRRENGLNQAEGEEQLTRVRQGNCPADTGYDPKSPPR